MSAFNDQWQSRKKTPAVDRWIARTAERGPDKPGLTRSYEPLGKPMTAEEFAAFQAKGGKIDYCAERMGKQLLNDERHQTRAKRHPLMDIVIDVLKVWDGSGYLGQHRKVVKNILAEPRNQRRRRLTEMSTMERRHQQAIRLVHALAIDGLNAAEHCRRSGLDPADATRMLAHLYQKEPGLADAMGAISACSAMTSWQNRQQTGVLRNSVRMIYGWNFNDVPSNGWLSGYSAGGVRRTSGSSFAPVGLIPDEPFRSFDLHQPEKWRKSHDVGFWNALHEPMRPVERYDLPLRFDEYRPISRQVLEKEKSKPTTWSISHAVPICDWETRPLGHCPHTWYPVSDIWIGWDPTRARYDRLDVDHGLVPIHIFGNDGRVIVRRLRRAELNPRPMCRPMHSGQVLVAIDRGILPDIELMWASYCRGTPSRKAHWVPRIVRQPNSALITPYSHRNWIPFPVKDRKHRLAIQLESGLRLYFVSSVTTDTASDPPAPEGGTLS